jgi:hypothetical protein
MASARRGRPMVRPDRLDFTNPPHVLTGRCARAWCGGRANKAPDERALLEHMHAAVDARDDDALSSLAESAVPWTLPKVGPRAHTHAHTYRGAHIHSLTLRTRVCCLVRPTCCCGWWC